MYRVDAKDKDTDALGLSNAATAQESAIQEGPFSDQTVWDQLKTVYDPEIPGDIRTRITKPVELRFALA
jgi:hypothetical protein